MPTIAASWVTFDCYGTLIDWESGIRDFFQSLMPGAAAASVQQALDDWEQVQFEMIAGPYRRYAAIMAGALERTLERFGRTYTPEKGEAFVAALPSWRPFPETNGALEALRAKGLKLGIISNIDDALIGQTLRHFTVPFDLVVTAEQAGAYKPSDAGFRLALERVGEPPSQVAHVAFGDRYDLSTAKLCGMRAVFVNRHGKHVAIPVDATIPDLTTLPALFP